MGGLHQPRPYPLVLRRAVVCHLCHRRQEAAQYTSTQAGQARSGWRSVERHWWDRQAPGSNLLTLDAGHGAGRAAGKGGADAVLVPPQRADRHLCGLVDQRHAGYVGSGLRFENQLGRDNPPSAPACLRMVPPVLTMRADVRWPTSGLATQAADTAP